MDKESPHLAISIFSVLRIIHINRYLSNHNLDALRAAQLYIDSGFKPKFSSFPGHLAQSIHVAFHNEMGTFGVFGHDRTQWVFDVSQHLGNPYMYLYLSILFE